MTSDPVNHLTFRDARDIRKSSRGSGGDLASGGAPGPGGAMGSGGTTGTGGGEATVGGGVGSGGDRGALHEGKRMEMRMRASG